MDNTLTSIAFALQSNKGVYALLLGSGISRSAGIPTGWEIVLDLIKKLALATQQDCGDNPASWFEETYREEPDYSNILSKLVYTSSERLNLLKNYFEPTEDELEIGLKQPSIAHKSIAKLAKKGVIRVVITTNFDRLLEDALREKGIEPIIIRHPQDIDGALPLVHNSFTIIKINGDYLDSRFLNTKDELDSYPDKLKEYVLRVINEYGLISCGWSGKWDIALRNLLHQADNFRFSNYWTYVGKCEDELVEIANYRKGKILAITDADIFFSEVYEKIEALDSFNDSYPINKEIAIARLKKYIVKDDGKIQLHDLLFKEQEEAYKKIFSISNYRLNNSPDLKNRLNYYEHSIDRLLTLSIEGVYWSRPEHEHFFLNILNRLSAPAKMGGSSINKSTINLHYIPCLLLFYGMALTAVVTKNFSFLYKLFKIRTAVFSYDHSPKIYLMELMTYFIIADDFNKIIGKEFITPINSYLNEKLRPLFQHLIYIDTDFNDLFAIFEYLLSLNYLYQVGEKHGYTWIPWGEYIWRGYHGRAQLENMFNDFFKNAEADKDNWAPIKAGMFGKSYKEYLKTKENVDNLLLQLSVL